MAERITPFLMFEGKAEEAMNFYLSLFPGARVEKLEHFGPEGPGPKDRCCAPSSCSTASG